MKPRFKDVLSCEKRAHCRLCRSISGGRSFRDSILALFPELEGTDFECPEGLPWDQTVRIKAISKTGYKSTENLLKSIAELPSENEAFFLLKSVTAQLQQLIRENRGGSCQDRAAYRRRLQEKQLYYIDRYGPPELKLQYPFKPSSSPLKSAADTPKNLA